MFGKKKTVTFDKTGKIPVIRSSVCTGEKTAGFKDIGTGKFFDLMLIKTGDDLSEFMRLYDVKPDEIRKEW